MIDVRSLTHHYGATAALRDVSLTVPRGAVVGLVGPNGAGKTTLIRAIATLLRLTRGVVQVDGYDTLRTPTKVRRVLGYLPERASPYPDLLAWEHLDLFAAIAGHRGAGKARRIDAALDAAGLIARRETPCAELSKGLRQRLALQATLLHDPVALVLDEPTDGLDPDSREALLATARHLADQGVAVLLSSHVLAEVEAVADDVVILSEGQVRSEVVLAGGPRFRVLLREPGEAGAAVVEALPGVASVSVRGAELCITLDEDQLDAAAVVAALVAAGQSVVEVHRDAATLRDRYRDAVARGTA